MRGGRQLAVLAAAGALGVSARLLASWWRQKARRTVQVTSTDQTPASEVLAVSFATRSQSSSLPVPPTTHRPYNSPPLRRGPPSFPHPSIHSTHQLYFPALVLTTAPSPPLLPSAPPPFHPSGHMRYLPRRAAVPLQDHLLTRLLH